MPQEKYTIEYEGDEKINNIDYTLAEYIEEEENINTDSYEIVRDEDKGDYREIDIVVQY